MKKYFFLLLAVVLCTGTVLAETTINRTVTATPGGEVSIEIIAGELTIIGWDRNEVLVEGVVGDDVEEVKVESDGDGVSIEVELDDDKKIQKEGYANLEIHVPAGATIDLDCVAVEIDVSGISGELEIESISGNITISGRPETMDIESISGNLLILDGADEIDIQSVSGTLKIEGGSLRDVDVESVSGKIEFSGDITPDGSLSVESVSGNVVVLVPAGGSATIDLSTFSGDFSSDFGEMEVRKEKFIPAKDAKFTIGGGGARISVETFSGNIEIRQR